MSSNKYVSTDVKLSVYESILSITTDEFFYPADLIDLLELIQNYYNTLVYFNVLKPFVRKTETKYKLSDNYLNTIEYDYNLYLIV